MLRLRRRPAPGLCWGSDGFECVLAGSLRLVLQADVSRVFSAQQFLPRLAQGVGALLVHGRHHAHQADGRVVQRGYHRVGGDPAGRVRGDLQARCKPSHQLPGRAHQVPSQRYGARVSNDIPALRRAAAFAAVRDQQNTEVVLAHERDSSGSCAVDCFHSLAPSLRWYLRVPVPTLLSTKTQPHSSIHYCPTLSPSPSSCLGRWCGTSS